MRSRAGHFFLATLILLLGQRIAGAHDSMETTLSFWVRATGIDVRIFISRGNASMLIEKAGEHVDLMRDSFSTYQERLAVSGSGLLSLTAGDGSELKADASSASITDEDDVCYTLHYPLPKVLPGSLNIHGNYLDKMDAAHVGSIYMQNATGDQIAQGEIRADSPDFEAQLPAVAAAPAKPQPATVAVPAPITSQSPRQSHWGLWTIIGGGVLVVAIIAARGIAMKAVDRKTCP
jgi:hypothetical protein